MRRACLAVLAVAVAGLIAACGSSHGGSVHRAAAVPKIGELPTPRPTGKPANPAAVAVIKAWSSTLRRGDVRGAARYFALPSELINSGTTGPVAIIIRTFAQAVSANASLPCGAVFISADQRGSYVNALFRLTNRPGQCGSC